MRSRCGGLSLRPAGGGRHVPPARQVGIECPPGPAGTGSVAAPGQPSHLPDLHPHPRWPPEQGRPICAPARPRPSLCPPPKATQLALRRDPLLQRPSTGQNEGKAGLLLLPWNLASLWAPRAHPPDLRGPGRLIPRPEQPGPTCGQVHPPRRPARTQQPAGASPPEASLDPAAGRCFPPRGQPGPSSRQVLLLDPGPCACAGAFQVDAPPGRCRSWEAPGVPRKYKQKEVFLSLRTSFPITRTCPKPVGPCAQQGGRCPGASECAFSRRRYQAEERSLAEPLPWGISSFKVPPGQSNHFISVLYTSSYQPFPNRKEENNVFIALPLPK